MFIARPLVFPFLTHLLNDLETKHGGAKEDTKKETRSERHKRVRIHDVFTAMVFDIFFKTLK